MSDSTDGGRTTRDVVKSLSAVVMVAGLIISVALLTIYWEVIVLFVLAGVFPSLLGFAGLSWTNALPWQGPTTASSETDEEDLVEELKRRYAKGELSDAEMERKVETLLGAEDDDGLSTTSREKESEFGRI